MTAPTRKRHTPHQTADDVPRPRSLSRGATVQALYQMDLAGTDLNTVIREFETLRLTPIPDAAPEGAAVGETAQLSEPDPGEVLEGADVQFFADLMRGVVRRQRDIDRLVDHFLAEGWRLVRIDSTLRAILRAGTFELLERPDVPVRVVISEYINIAHAFFDGDEPRVVNGVLDRIARRVRASEIPGLPPSAGPRPADTPGSSVPEATEGE